MKQTAYFYSKPVDRSLMGYFPYADPEKQCEYIIKAKYEMSEEQFSSFTMNLLEDQPFIQDFNKENIMHRDLNNIENVIEVYCKENDYSLLVNSEGYSYARYVAIIPNQNKKFIKNPLIDIKDVNHFRNAYYNAPIGTLEHAIANALNRFEELKKQFPNLLQDAIQRGYGVEHTGDVQAQEIEIIRSVMERIKL